MSEKILENVEAEVLANLFEDNYSNNLASIMQQQELYKNKTAPVQYTSGIGGALGRTIAFLPKNISKVFLKYLYGVLNTNSRHIGSYTSKGGNIMLFPLLVSENIDQSIVSKFCALLQTERAEYIRQYFYNNEIINFKSDNEISKEFGSNFYEEEIIDDYYNEIDCLVEVFENMEFGNEYMLEEGFNALLELCIETELDTELKLIETIYFNSNNTNPYNNLIVPGKVKKTSMGDFDTGYNSTMHAFNRKISLDQSTLDNKKETLELEIKKFEQAKIEFEEKLRQAEEQHKIELAKLQQTYESMQQRAKERKAGEELQKELLKLKNEQEEKMAKLAHIRQQEILDIQQKFANEQRILSNKDSKRHALLVNWLNKRTQKELINIQHDNQKELQQIQIDAQKELQQTQIDANDKALDKQIGASKDMLKTQLKTQAKEAKKQRKFQAKEAKKQQKHQSKEAEKQRAFQAKEAEKQRQHQDEMAKRQAYEKSRSDAWRANDDKGSGAIWGSGLKLKTNDLMPISPTNINLDVYKAITKENTKQILGIRYIPHRIPFTEMKVAFKYGIMNSRLAVRFIKMVTGDISIGNFLTKSDARALSWELTKISSDKKAWNTALKESTHPVSILITKEEFDYICQNLVDLTKPERFKAFQKDVGMVDLIIIDTDAKEFIRINAVDNYQMIHYDIRDALNANNKDLVINARIDQSKLRDEDY